MFSFIARQDAVDAFQRKHRGLITLLFTDMASSTALKQALGDEKAAELFARHHSILRAILKEFPDAEEIETAGDSFFLVFSTPSSAVRFATQLRKALLQLSGEAAAEGALHERNQEDREEADGDRGRIEHHAGGLSRAETLVSSSTFGSPARPSPADRDADKSIRELGGPRVADAARRLLDAF